ncbi:hypothetical protein [Streptomyces luteolus]|uniref:Uncharacterized protein n=1 Tax=Streptomyces luteolus TaxID=3043615 RepID=A0ABT6T4P0_9ACTN|nr:hypothetical protein [Streptomyces sp. B-S-A12]MDI3422804.1 hypothetical protein [Streptomyces sp. B-S-A12]
MSTPTILIATQQTIDAYHRLIDLATRSYADRHTNAGVERASALRHFTLGLIRRGQGAEVAAFAAHQAADHLHARGMTWGSLTPQLTGLRHLDPESRTVVTDALAALETGNTMLVQARLHAMEDQGLTEERSPRCWRCSPGWVRALSRAATLR